MNPVSLSDSVYLYFSTASSSTGAATNADSTPTVTVAEDGTDMGYAPTVTNVATGLYKVQIDATAGNGFEAGRRYSAYVVATVGGIAGRDGIGEFEVLAVDLNAGVASVQGNVTGSVASVSGAVGSVTAAITLPTIPADWITAAGIAANAITSTEAPALANLDAAVTSRMASFTLPTNFSSLAITAGGAVTVGTNNDKTGYSLTQAFPTNFSALAITGGGALTVGTNNDKTGYSLTQTFPTNFAAMVITAGGIVDADVETWRGSVPSVLISGRVDANAQVVGDKTGYAVSSIGADVIAATSIAADAGTELAAAVWASGTRTLTASLDPSASVVADAVWDEARSGHVGAGSFGEYIDAAISSRLATSGYTVPLDAAGTRAALGLASANLDSQIDAIPTVAETVAGLLTTVITEAYRSTGAAPTLAQFMSEVLSHLGEASISGTVKTIKKFDGTTNAATFNLDSAGSPTSITRAT